MLELARKSGDAEEVIEEAPRRSPDYDTAQALACKALLLADTYQTPPVPRAYAVWYAYAAGEPETVKLKINEIVEGKGSLDSYELDQIHIEHLSVSEEQHRRQTLFSQSLDSEMDAVMTRVQAHLESSNDYSGSLQSTAAGLSAESTPAQVINAIELLLAENARIRHETALLHTSLEQTRTQVRKLRTSLEESREKEMRDPMTNLSNRRFFETRLPREIAEARRTGADLCLALVDVDHFKRINDTFGHLVGDDVLRYVASILRKNIRGHHIAARYGGEEFVLVFPDTGPAAAGKIIEAVMRDLAESNLVLSEGKSPVGRITMSGGIARLQDGEEPKELIARADGMLYEAKNAGRNRILRDD